MRVEKVVVGQLGTNCYLVWDEKTRKTIIIDPGDDGDYIIRKIQDFKLSPVLIIATHGHFDHVLAALELKLAFSIPFLIHKADSFLLNRASSTAKHFLGIKVDPQAMQNRFVKEGDIISFGQEKLKVLETPGHSPGGISLLGKGVVFSGDTIFADGFGRTDFSYGSKEDLEKSVKKLFKLPEDTIVYPGHGEETTIGEIKSLM
ncbi:MAG: beta-lactamase domain-containing protein [Microgenomates group bacterium LiPW_16]|nr:MAG: beta-lactamase domain-containing protein [Microgenomates group bacterium LiPW_16]